ncbi:hypothetical protein [Collimonas pratensis]|uniref:DUF2171 domain-containing protein n=1 Tax=Collimonas pratensis TaxID=279113 RepID=A0ABN4M8B6_9BURK|nr:hypothetical protein [Collimonas pratensis]AMP13697.1 hypothetical protein CPter291_1423 [Collimonas pratensis]
MESKKIDWLGRTVAHEGITIGIVTQIRPNVANGRRYAFVQPHNQEHGECRIPVDELTLADAA